MRKIHGLIISLLVLTLTACQKNEVSTDKPEEEKNYYQEINDINVLDKNATKFIDEEITSDSRIVFSADTPEDAIPKVGTGIFIPESEKAPYGMLSRVLSVNKDSERTVVTTEPLPLADAFESLSIDSSSPWEATLEGVFDEDGNPVEYEIVGKPGEATRSTDFELTENGLSIPVRTGQESGDGSYSIAGNVGIYFEKFDLSIDIDKHGVKGISLVAAPSLEVDFGGNVELKAERERVIELFRKQIHTVRFKIRIPTPVAGIPIIIPVRISFDCLFEASGTVAWDFGVKYKNTLDCKVVFENGKWGSEVKSVKSSDGNPWTVTQNLGVDGEIDLGVKVGILAGLYTTNLGIGVYATPKVYLGGEAKLDSEDLYKVNPSLEYGLKVSSEVFAIAKLFGKDLGKYNVELPDNTIWSKALPLLPSLSGFEIKRIANATKSATSESSGEQASVEIIWRQNPEYFLSSKDVKTGVAIFNKASGTEVASFMPAPESESDGSYSYKTTVQGLSMNRTYYAETFAYWDGYKKFGETQDFTILKPTAVTGKVDLINNSAIIDCEYINAEGMWCGLKYSYSREDGLKGEGEISAASDGEQSITIPDLEPLATYTYYAVIRYGDNTFVGESKSFTSGPPDISGTWKCTETRYNNAGKPKYTTYSVTLNEDGSVLYSESGEIVSSSWLLNKTGKVSISIMDLAMQSQNSGKKWSGKINDYSKPTRITGTTYRWNSNHIGYFEGDAVDFEMTK